MVPLVKHQAKLVRGGAKRLPSCSHVTELQLLVRFIVIISIPISVIHDIICK